MQNFELLVPEIQEPPPKGVVIKETYDYNKSFSIVINGECYVTDGHYILSDGSVVSRVIYIDKSGAKYKTRVYKLKSLIERLEQGDINKKKKITDDKDLQKLREDSAKLREKAEARQKLSKREKKRLARLNRGTYEYVEEYNFVIDTKAFDKENIKVLFYDGSSIYYSNFLKISIDEIEYFCKITRTTSKNSVTVSLLYFDYELIRHKYYTKAEELSRGLEYIYRQTYLQFLTVRVKEETDEEKFLNIIKWIEYLEELEYSFSKILSITRLETLASLYD